MISATGEPAVRDGTETFLVSLKLRNDDSFEVAYDDVGPDAMATDRFFDGVDRSPPPTRLLAASIGTCLAASLLHCLRKGRVPVESFEATAVVSVERNEKGRLRVRRVNVLLDPRVGAEFAARLERCTSLFEDYCTVAESVRQGIDVRVTVATN